MISFLRCDLLKLDKMFSDDDEIISMNPNGDPDSVDVWYRPNGRAELRNAATEAASEAEQPQQPLCASGQAKLPSFKDVKEYISNCTDVKDFSRNFAEGLRLCYLAIKELGNFTKR